MSHLARRDRGDDARGDGSRARSHRRGDRGATHARRRGIAIGEVTAQAWPPSRRRALAARRLGRSRTRDA
ncbi:MAG: hypothetical protein IPH80_34830 [Myxococcales bacterium]|nr:hypothetical protein [Myxococcales bacterium]MBP6849275.1 hypothetical protein [Kofleriaceae bacterium]